ncbi:MAG: hypothetical protein RRB22_05710 [Gammaproteobacteria bacterium]|nr:hypothetical protein [Gammaproteobacteria bacterium]
MAEQELARAETWLREAFEDIMRNVDSNVVKIKEEEENHRGAVAFDGLAEGDADE